MRAWLLAILTVTSACGGDVALSSVTGRLMNADQNGVEGVQVELARGGTPTGAMATTNADGRFELEVPMGATAGELEVWLLVPAGVWGFIFPSSVDPSFDFGDVPVWTPNVQVNQLPSGVEVDWIDMFSWFDRPVTFTLSADAAEGTVWEENVDTSNLMLDARVLEDRDVSITVGVFSSSMGASPGLSFDTSFLEAPVSASGTVVPVSRGSRCQVDGVDSGAGACPLTDGLFGDGVTGPITEVLVVLGGPTDLSAVTLHGADHVGTATANIGWSPDCTGVFEEIQTTDLSSPYALISFQMTSTACIRVRFDQPIASLDEVGLW